MWSGTRVGLPRLPGGRPHGSEAGRPPDSPIFLCRSPAARLILVSPAPPAEPMPHATFTDALTDLCRAAGPDALPDGDLLRRFAESRDQPAFAALIRRHGRVVWGAAVRRTGDHQAAEDVFQATFLALARRAGRLHGRTSLSGWLYTVAVRLARRAARSDPTRRPLTRPPTGGPARSTP